MPDIFHDRLYQIIDRIGNAGISIFDAPSSEVSVTFPDRGTEGYRGRRTTKLIRRTKNGSSPYFCDSSRPVHPSGSGSHYRSMDGRGGKGEKGSSSVRGPLVPRSPFSLSPSPCVPSPTSLRLSSSDPVFLSLSFVLSLNPPCAFSLAPASVTCSPAPFGFRYLIKSSYDEKDEDPARRTRGSVVVLPFLFTGRRSRHARAGRTEE